MNYKESQKILEEIKKANRVLVNCHRAPDGDSVGSAVAISHALNELGKEVQLICVDEVAVEYAFLLSDSPVKKINYESFDFSGYDLFILPDSSTWSQVSGDKDIKVPNIKKIAIDHHFTNDLAADISLVDSQRSSTSEILFRVFNDIGITFTKDIAQALLTGIIYDTSTLQNSAADTETVWAFVELMKFGANKDEIVSNLYKSLSFEKVKALAEVLQNLQIDRENGFVWTAISFEDYKKYKDAHGVKTMVANLFGSSIADTDFGIVMVEESQHSLNISFRARTNFDTSKIAHALGGGGHKKASAARVDGLPFDEAVEKVLETARKYATKT